MKEVIENVMNERTVELIQRKMELSIVGSYIAFAVLGIFVLFIICFLFYWIWGEWLSYVVSDIKERIVEKRTEPYFEKFSKDEVLSKNFEKSNYRKYMLKQYLMTNGVESIYIDDITNRLWKFYKY